jgi:type II secretory pathway pseudopilin PulG
MTGIIKKRIQSLGFTLIEVILALGLTSLILGLLSTGVFLVADDWNRNSDVLDQSLDEALSILQIDRSLHGAFPHSFTNEETLSRQLFFTGEDDYLSWVSTVSPQRSAGLTTWELYSVAGEGTYLTLVPAYSDNPRSRLDEAEPMLLFPGYEVEFSYLYEELDENKVWIEEWEAQELLSLPLAVYVRFTPADDEKELLEIVARIRNNQHRSIQPNDLEIRDL